MSDSEFGKLLPSEKTDQLLGLVSVQFQSVHGHPPVNVHDEPRQTTQPQPWSPGSILHNVPRPVSWVRETALKTPFKFTFNLKWAGLKWAWQCVCFVVYLDTVSQESVDCGN